MTAYADVEFYKNEYLYCKKAVITTAFYYYACRATQEIRRFTGSNVEESDIPKCVKMCCCEIAELLFKADNCNSQIGVTSTKTGDVSVSYESSESQRQVLSKKIKSVIYLWLAGTGLLYRGAK